MKRPLPREFAALTLGLAGVLALLAAAGAAAAPAPAATNAVVIDAAPFAIPPAEIATKAYRNDHYLGPDIPAGDGFADGGRGMKIGGDGRLGSSREILILDRSRDAKLREQLAWARSKEVMSLDPAARTVQICRYVVDTMGGKHITEDENIPPQTVSKGVLLNDFATLAGSGVCRHRAAMFKALADEAGLSAAIVRGYRVHRDGRKGGHAWNEVHLPDGKALLVDPMIVPHGYAFPDLKTPAATARYLGRSKEQIYFADKYPARAPRIAVQGDPPYVHTATVEVCPAPGLPPLHYTLDGSAPTTNSPRYKTPFTVKASTTVRAIAAYPDGRISAVSTRAIRVLKPTPAVNPPAAARPGLHWDLFKGSFTRLPDDLDKRQPDASGVVEKVALPPNAPPDTFALRFKGCLRVPRDGVYQFFLSSDEGSKLWIGDDLVVDNDGRRPAAERTGWAELKAGVHPLTITYFELDGPESLSLEMAAPGSKRLAVPPASLLCGPK